MSLKEHAGNKLLIYKGIRTGGKIMGNRRKPTATACAR